MSAPIHQLLLVGSGPTTWNPADKSSNINLSNNNLTAQCSNTTIGGVRGTSSRKVGKLYFEIKNTGSSAGTSTAIGIGTSTASFTAGLGGGWVNAFVLQEQSIAFFNGSNLGSSASFPTASQVACFAIDLTNSRAWVRNGSGIWNNSGSANPATNVGGVNISAVFPTSPAFIFSTYNATAPVMVLNAGGAAFAQTVPSGFSAWG